MASAPPVQEEPLQPGTNHFRSLLAAAVRSISWSYAIFWSISTSCPGVLTWNDGFYNGVVKTRKISKSADLTAGQLVVQRSEQLRELYYSLLSGECDHRARRPIAALSPEDLADTEWYYVVCMTYSFQPGQGLPGKSYASNASVWLRNAQSADSKTFLRSLLAKSASIQTIICIPFTSGVLELGTTDPVLEDPNLVNRIVAYFQELQFPICLEVLMSTSPSPNETEDADIVSEGLITHNAIEEGQMVVSDECVSNANRDPITMEIDELYSIYEDLDLDTVRFLEDNGWPVNPSSFQLVPASSTEAVAAAAAANDVDGVANSQVSCFMAWKSAKSNEMAVPVVTGIESQKLLKKVVDCGARMSTGRGSRAALTQESGIKNHVISERRRREKLNEMFLILKSIVPSIHKVDKASILEETIAYLKVLEKRVKELESSSEPSHQRATETGQQRRCEITGKELVSEIGVSGGGDAGREHHHVNVTVTDKVVLLEVQCRWKELVMTRVFDAIKSLCLDVLSVQASAPDGLLGLKIQAKFACSGSVAPGMISEALQKAIGG
uniref:BHLH domain-containing protein n=1 Tax=Oryza glaberrima TaxID=4538 RepID=I1PNR9_ORYGL